MPLLEIAALGAGAAIVLLGLADAFLTILHPDLDGPVTRALNRGIWRVATEGARLVPQHRRDALAFAGPVMIVADVLLWMILPILGYALMVWPFLDRGFDAAPELSTQMMDAIYFSGVTFTTLGFGDITPLTSGWELLSVAEAVSGFLVMSTSIAYVIAVFEGVDHRDALALRIYSETDATWQGQRFLERSLLDEGPDALRERLESWAGLVRELHGRLYRFHGLAFYLRTQGIRHGPERMMYAVAEVALAANILSRAPEMRPLRPAARHLSIAFEHFASAIVRRHGTALERRLMSDPEPGAEDAERIRAVGRELCARLQLPPMGVDPAEDPELLALVARKRVFLRHVDGFTHWRRTLSSPDAPFPGT